jgi:hypothetical protein
LKLKLENSSPKSLLIEILHASYLVRGTESPIENNTFSSKKSWFSNICNKKAYEALELMEGKINLRMPMNLLVGDIHH